MSRMMDFIKDIGSVKVDAAHKKSWKTFLEYPTLTHVIFQLQNSLAPVTRALLYRTMVAPAIKDAMRFVKQDEARRRVQHAFLRDDGPRRGEAPLGHRLQDRHLPDRDLHLPRALEGARDRLVPHRLRPRGPDRPPGTASNGARSRPSPTPSGRDFLESRRDRAAVAAELGLESDRRTFLFSFGNQGAGMILQYLIALDLLGVPLNVIVVAGLNKSLRARLSANRTLLSTSTSFPLGFVSNMNELIDAADVCFIKPGPATMMECMHSRKPIIFNVAATPCEQAHANYAVFRGVAKYTDGNPMLFGIAARHFLKDEAREEVARRYERLALRNGAADIAAFVDSVARGETRRASRGDGRGPASRAQGAAGPGRARPSRVIVGHRGFLGLLGCNVLLGLASSFVGSLHVPLRRA